MDPRADDDWELVEPADSPAEDEWELAEPAEPPIVHAGLTPQQGAELEARQQELDDLYPLDKLSAAADETAARRAVPAPASSPSYFGQLLQRLGAPAQAFAAMGGSSAPPLAHELALGAAAQKRDKFYGHVGQGFFDLLAPQVPSLGTMSQGPRMSPQGMAPRPPLAVDEARKIGKGVTTLATAPLPLGGGKLGSQLLGAAATKAPALLKAAAPHVGNALGETVEGVILDKALGNIHDWEGLKESAKWNAVLPGALLGAKGAARALEGGSKLLELVDRIAPSLKSIEKQTQVRRSIEIA
jgi:hypothetical protein